MSRYQRMFVVYHISTFLVMWLPVTSVSLDSIRLTYCFYHISLKIFSKKMAMPLYCFNHLFRAILMSFTDPRLYNFIFNKMLSLKWLWFYQTLPFDIFWYVCKHQQISVYIVHICMLLILLPCIYSRTLAHVATVTCWLYPTLNKFYLILSYLMCIIFFIMSNPGWVFNCSSKA